MLLHPCVKRLPALGAVLLASCGGGTSPTPVAASIQVGHALAAEQTLTRGLDAMPRSLDPTLVTDTDGQKVTDDLFEGLTAIGPDDNVVPGVASSWEVSADGRTWVFHLRPEARWSNGEPVLAGDFVYAWRREVDPKTGAENAQALSPILNASAIATGQAPVDSLGVTAVDDHTLRVTLVSPTPYLLAVLADSYLQPLPRATVERYGDSWSRPEHMVSNGPYVLGELIVGDRITLTRNPRYWGAATVRVSRVTYYPLNRNAQVSRFMAGDVEFTSIFPSSQIHWLRSQLGNQVATGTYLGVQMFGFNMVAPPFAHNRNLRLALTMAVDRRIIADKITQGVSKPAYCVVPPLPGYTPQLPQWASWSDDRRHAEARRLYAAAGYSAAHPLHVQLDYPSDEDNRDLLTAIAAMWRINLGAQVEPYDEEFRVLLQDLRLQKATLFWASWIGDYPDPFTFLQLGQKDYAQNFGLINDPRFESLLAAAGNEPDNARRYRYLEQAEDRLNEEAYFVPLVYYATRHLVKPYIQGWRPNLQDRMATRYLQVLEHRGR
ncbi:MAG TPA: peptide ABC transporter substrate-binding protein [Steroidobacteraceae bacterium]|nr:peptide ABC transporter substrate-binding protein [Steroidobacteraceae bacterium]